MTPLYLALCRRLPRPVALMLLVAVYAGTLLAVTMAIAVRPPDILYIDIPDAGEAR